MHYIKCGDVYSKPGLGSWALRLGFRRWIVAALAVCSIAQAQSKEPEPAPLPGCEDQVTAGGPGGKQDRFFPMPLDKVKTAATNALNALEFEVKKNASNTIEAHKSRHLGVFIGSGGENIKLSFKEASEGGQSGTQVTGETKKTVIGRLAQKNWTTAVLAQTACVLQKEANK
jgi:hypothetical protein